MSASRKGYMDKFIGKKYSRLTILEEVGVVNNKRRVLAICDCGITKEYKIASLLYGNTKSCGCLNTERINKHGLCDDPLYSVWAGMLARCYNPKHPSFKNYGARGVTVSTRWIDNFKAFYQWAKDKWKFGLQLDKDIRSDGKNGNFYCPELCCFATPLENINKRQNTIVLNFNKESLPMSEWARRVKIPYSTFISRRRLGWSDEEIITTPIQKQNKR